MTSSTNPVLELLRQRKAARASQQATATATAAGPSAEAAQEMPPKWLTESSRLLRTDHRLPICPPWACRAATGAAR